MKQPLLVKYDPRYLSRVYVRDLHGRHWPIHYADLRQPPIALWELEAARKQLRQQGSGTPFEQAIFASILEQREIVKNSRSTSKQRRMKEKIPATPSILRTNPIDQRDSSAATENQAFSGGNLGGRMNIGEPAHLQPSCRSAALLMDDERVHWLRQERRIQYPRAQRILDRLMELVDYPPRDRMPALLIYGMTGMGKTRIIQKFLRDPVVMLVPYAKMPPMAARISS